ncbi:MAG: hypothetical protein LAP38_24300 [Acidobacteriia bacterium]|nr:hypothetical protein [Terriglobia bacterium]
MYQSIALTDDSSHLSLDGTANAPQYLVPPCTERSDGMGPVADLGLDHAGLLVITLGINHVLEHEGIAVSVWGSADGSDWGTKPLVSLPQKCYCGIYSTFLDLSKHPQVRYLRVRWNMVRWGKWEHVPLFGFYVSAQESGDGRH